MVVVEADRLGGPTFVTYVRLTECVHLTEKQIFPGKRRSLAKLHLYFLKYCQIFLDIRNIHAPIPEYEDIC